LLCTAIASAQIRVSGKVYDASQSRPLEAVSVMSTSGNGAATDREGRYSILVTEKDSIWFSYLGKPTPKFAVTTIPNILNFEISLHVNVLELKQVTVMPKNYRVDSLQNRIDYARAFNFRKPDLQSLTSINPSGGGVGLDINEFIRLFQFRRNRRMEAFQERLLREEEEKYIDHRFSRAIIIRLTQLHGPELDTFVRRYRPPVEFVDIATDYELQYYIKQCFDHYQRMKRIEMQLRKPDE
jgi:hypothetical protein